MLMIDIVQDIFKYIENDILISFFSKNQDINLLIAKEIFGQKTINECIFIFLLIKQSQNEKSYLEKLLILEDIFGRNPNEYLFLLELYLKNLSIHLNKNEISYNNKKFYLLPLLKDDICNRDYEIYLIKTITEDLVTNHVSESYFFINLEDIISYVGMLILENFKFIILDENDENIDFRFFSEKLSEHIDKLHYYSNIHVLYEDMEFFITVNNNITIIVNKRYSKNIILEKIRIITHTSSTHRIVFFKEISYIFNIDTKEQILYYKI